MEMEDVIKLIDEARQNNREVKFEFEEVGIPKETLDEQQRMLKYLAENYGTEHVLYKEYLKNLEEYVSVMSRQKIIVKIKGNN
jgi:formyltetrahydrofolate hydrolase